MDKDIWNLMGDVTKKKKEMELKLIISISFFNIFRLDFFQSDSII